MRKFPFSFSWKREGLAAPEPKVRDYRFDPKPDITAFELAWVWGNFAYGIMTVGVPAQHVAIDDEGWERIPHAVQRHFKLNEEGKQ